MRIMISLFYFYLYVDIAGYACNIPEYAILILLAHSLYLS